MGIVVDFSRRHSGGVLPNGSAVNLARASGVQLRYSLFMGDLILRAKQVDLSSRFGDVALLSVLTGLPAACSQALTSKRGEYRFQERDEALVVEASGSLLRLTCSYAHGVIEADRLDFTEALLGFIGECTMRLIRDHPDLLENPQFLDLVWRT